MNEKMLILIRKIEADCQTIETIYPKIRQIELEQSADEDSLIVLAYHLNNLYNAFENIFQQIAVNFENNLDDRAGWHKQLLDRMLLDLRPIRPNLIDQTTYEPLDELRRFRHLFRSAYTIRLDAQRLQLVQQQALRLQKAYRSQIDAFIHFLQTID